MMYMLHRCIASKSHELNREQLATILWSYANVNHHPGNEMMELLEKKVRWCSLLFLDDCRLGWK